MSKNIVIDILIRTTFALMKIEIMYYVNAIKVSFQKEKGCVIFEDICYAIRSKQKQSNIKNKVYTIQVGSKRAF